MALLNITSRNFPVQVNIADAQYTWRSLPSGVSPATDPYEPFYQNALDGKFSGVTGGTTQYNRGCAAHSPSDKSDSDSDKDEDKDKDKDKDKDSKSDKD